MKAFLFVFIFSSVALLATQTHATIAPGAKPLPRVLPSKVDVKKQLRTLSLIEETQDKSFSRHRLRRLNSFKKSELKLATDEQAPMIFDLPVTYNYRVKKWIKYFQTSGKKWFTKWLERSSRHIPPLQEILIKENLPNDLVYVAMIESGFSSQAVSSASAVGPWQFIRSTGEQYGLQVNWWIDERRDFTKSTHAAAKYLQYLHRMFNSWYLAAAAYNMGENRLKRLIKRYGTKDYWKLSMKRGFAKETKDYVPKLMAAILISKAPGLYGFRDIKPHSPYRYDIIDVPGGTDLPNLADHLSVTRRHLLALNPELKLGFVPKFVRSHAIRVPKGAQAMTRQFVDRAKGLYLSQREN